MKYTSVDAWKAYWEFTKKYPQYIFESFLTGSTIINREGADIDICVKAKRSDVKKFIKEGWEPCGELEGYKGTSWQALRKGEVNLIIVFNKKQYTAWSLATLIFQDLYTIENLKPSKLARIKVFELIRNMLDEG